MAQLQNFKEVIATLQAKAAKVKKDQNVSVSVGYSAAYAIYVHENLEAKHPNGGQAKFLEQPAREYQSVFAQIIRTALQQGKTMAQALLLAGLRLQRESQKLVPIDTGALRASAFTRLNNEG